MKLSLLVGLVFMANTFTASQEILHYRYGNQINHSELSVLEDGTAIVTESTCCPPHSLEPQTFYLSEGQFTGLQSAIENSSSAEIKTETGSPTVLGSASGELTVTTETGKKVIIRQIERAETLGENDKVTFNTAPQARWIEDFVLDHVEQQMYRGLAN